MFGFFFFFVFRGYINIEDDSSYVVGQEEAIWLVKLFLPYLNEFLLKLKALFSGDPATTMKVYTNSLFCFFFLVLLSGRRKRIKLYECVNI